MATLPNNCSLSLAQDTNKKLLGEEPLVDENLLI
jgi:hypothetical protein